MNFLNKIIQKWCWWHYRNDPYIDLTSFFLLRKCEFLGRHPVEEFFPTWGWCWEVKMGHQAVTLCSWSQRVVEVGWAVTRMLPSVCCQHALGVTCVCWPLGIRWSTFSDHRVKATWVSFLCHTTRIRTQLLSGDLDYFSSKAFVSALQFSWFFFLDISAGSLNPYFHLLPSI